MGKYELYIAIVFHVSHMGTYGKYTFYTFSLYFFFNFICIKIIQKTHKLKPKVMANLKFGNNE